MSMKDFLSERNQFNKERELLNDTIFKYSSTLKSFLEWCFDENLIKSREAFSRAKTKIKKKAKNEIVALTEVELFKIVNVFATPRGTSCYHPATFRQIRKPCNGHI